MRVKQVYKHILIIGCHYLTWTIWSRRAIAPSVPAAQESAPIPFSSWSKAAPATTLQTNNAKSDKHLQKHSILLYTVTYVLCMYYVCTMYLLSMYYIFTMYVLCIYYVCTMYVLCMYYVCTMYALCIYYVWLCIYYVCTMYALCMYNVFTYYVCNTKYFPFFLICS